MDKPCTRPPPGWTCTRGAGHEGPCAATKATGDAAMAAAKAFHQASNAGASSTQAWQAVVEAVLANTSHPSGLRHVPKDILEARAQGRAEALAIVLALEAESGLDDYISSYPTADTGDYGSEWDEAKLRELFRADDTAYSLMQEAEGLYWERLGLRDETEEIWRRVVRESKPQPVAVVGISQHADVLHSRMSFTRLTDAGRELPTGNYELYTKPQSPVQFQPRVAVILSDDGSPGRQLYLAAELQDRRMPDGTPVYKTLDPVVPAHQKLPGVPASRPEDMSEKGRLHLFPQDDGDMVVRVVDGDDERHVAIEFCASGGRSPHTLQALRDLSHAMSRDNAEEVRS